MNAINIILDETDPQAPIFVEIKNNDGKSIRIGERHTDSSGPTRIRITVADLLNNGAGIEGVEI